MKGAACTVSSRSSLLLSCVGLVVARWRESTEGSIRAAIKLLPLQSISHIGVALNGIDLRKKLQLGGNDATAFYNRYKSYYRSELA